MTKTGRLFAERFAPTSSAFDIRLGGSAAVVAADAAVAGGSTTALPGWIESGEFAYGKLFEVVVNESGSLRSAKSRHAAKPSAGPSFCCRPASSCDEWTSLPPPLPKTAPISDAAAATSLSVHGLALFFVFL